MFGKEFPHFCTTPEYHKIEMFSFSVSVTVIGHNHSLKRGKRLEKNRQNIIVFKSYIVSTCKNGHPLAQYRNGLLNLVGKGEH